MYGTTTLADIEARLAARAEAAGVMLETFQSNAESALIERVQRVFDAPVDFIIVNPAGLTHTSVALRDALVAVAVPFIEVHLSNVFAREPFRQHSYFTDKAVGIVSGLGPFGYEAALEHAIRVPA